MEDLTLSALVDHDRLGTSPELVTPLMRAFAANPIYRSATVDELVLRDNVFRRPLRPEDLDFLDFSSPLESDTVTSLGALAGHRMLLCIAETVLVTLPQDPSAGTWTDFERTYSPRNRLLGEMIRPFLERQMFGFLHEDEGSVQELRQLDVRRVCSRLDEIIADRANAAVATASAVSQAPVGAGRLLLVQLLAGLRSVALASERVRGALRDALPADVAGTLGILDELARLLRRQAAAAQVETTAHAHWQFYLPTSLALANHVHHLSAHPPHLFRLLGALTFCARDVALAVEANRELFPQEAARLPGLSRSATDVPAVLISLAARYGRFVIGEFAIGFGRQARLKALADADFDEQARWLSHMPHFTALARELLDRIERDGATIERDTFVEPREMCSTTHVHDDDRLVLVESGEMVFWNYPGMRLHLGPGEMILVPRHRLHGSSVVSPACTYHQPIIPDDWLPLAKPIAGSVLSV